MAQKNLSMVYENIKGRLAPLLAGENESGLIGNQILVNSLPTPLQQWAG